MKKINLEHYTLCLIILIFMNTTAVYCQENTFEKTNFGVLWFQFDAKEKLIYLSGVGDGILVNMESIFIEDEDGLKGFSDTEKIHIFEFISKKFKEIRENMFVLAGIMDDLYEDSANSYIRYPLMVDIAMNKLKGQDIEPLLRSARKEALNGPKAVNEMKQKGDDEIINFNAIVEANCGTIQTLIQLELLDFDYEVVKGYIFNTNKDNIFNNSGIINPHTGLAQRLNGYPGERGSVVVTYDDEIKKFFINGNNYNNKLLLSKPLSACR